jgi:hypothetical protein
MFAILDSRKQGMGIGLIQKSACEFASMPKLTKRQFFLLQLIKVFIMKLVLFVSFSNDCSGRRSDQTSDCYQDKRTSHCKRVLLRCPGSQDCISQARTRSAAQILFASQIVSRCF